MKNLFHKKLSCIILIILCVSIACLLGYKSTPLALKPIEQTIGGLTLRIDPRIELLSAIQTLSTYDSRFGLITDQDFSYKQDILSYFKDFSDHEAIKLFDEMSSQSFSYDAPPTAMLYLTDHLSLNSDLQLDPLLLQRAGGAQTLETFLVALKQFATDTNFESFYNDHQTFYSQMLQENSKILEGTHYIPELEAYYGMKNNSYTVIMAPMYHSGGFGPRVQNKKGTYDIYSIQGPMQVVNDIPIFGDAQSFENLVWHEFGHSFINPLTEKYLEEVNQYAKLYEPIATQMAQNAYTSWQYCINEHLLRAVTARRAYTTEGQTSYENCIRNEKSIGFLYVEALAEKIAFYENNRDTYKDFDAFYPEMIKVFESLSSSDLGKTFYSIPFEGPINATFSLQGETVFITPTHEDANLQKNIDNFCKQFMNLLINNLALDITMVNDTESLSLDLNDKNIIVLGTMEGNLWLSQNKESFPFQITKDQVIADKAYEGNNLKLISALPHPTNTNHSLLVYTAQQSSDLININSIFHGPTDYVIAEKDTVLKDGNYTKANHKWTF